MELFNTNNLNKMSSRIYSLKFSTYNNLAVKIDMLPYIKFFSQTVITFVGIDNKDEAILINGNSPLFIDVSGVPYEKWTSPVVASGPGKYYFSAKEGSFANLPKWIFEITKPYIYEATLDPGQVQSMKNMRIINSYNEERWETHDGIRQKEDQILEESNENRESSGIEELY